MLAQHLTKKLRGDAPMYYWATMIPVDQEDQRRIEHHRADRFGWGYETIECGRNLSAAFDRVDPNGTVLMDSLTALMSNEMFHDGTVDYDAAQRTAEELRLLGEHCANVVYVSDIIYCDAGRYDEITEAYRRGLAQVDRSVAAICDVVVELCCGIPVVHKGILP